jgi:hypothetical protein
MYEPPRTPWEESREPQRYLGLSAAVFDSLVIGVLAIVAIGVWIFVFHAWLPNDAEKLDPRVALGLKDDEPELAAVFLKEGGPDLKEVFATSGGSFTNDVRSFRGEAQIAMTAGGSDMTMQMEYGFVAPGKMHIQTDAPFGRTEMLMDLPNIYLRPEGKGWYLMTGDALGLNTQALQRLIEQRGVMDYSSQAAALDGLTQLSDARIDEESYFHYQGQIEFSEALNDLPAGLVDPAVISQVAAASGPITVETWLDKETALPRRVTIDMDLAIEGNAMSMDLQMDFLDYNEPVDIPAVPVDARPITELNVADLTQVAVAA